MNTTKKRFINSKKSSKSNEIPLPEEKVFKSIKVNHPIFIDDGKIKLKVLKVSKNIIETKVISEGVLKSKKGINLPETVLKNSALTLADKKNVKKAMELGVDWVALGPFLFVTAQGSFGVGAAD